ncbi:MAG: G4 quadruplex nucleic acid binding protein [Lichina confinis]|nr:MAG: G4 quadruplex nucleic acid binding protein [Lichina confinis]
MAASTGKGEHAGSSPFHEIQYTESETAEIKRWTSLTETPLDKTLRDLDEELCTRTTILRNKPSTADEALYKWLKPTVAQWTPEQRTGEHGYHHIVRYMDFVQNSPLFGLSTSSQEKISINLDEVIAVPKIVDQKEVKEQKKKEKVASTGTGQAEKQPKTDSKEQGTAVASDVDAGQPNAASTANAANQTTPALRPKKEKQPTQPKQPSQKASTAPAGPTPSRIDLRVGHVLKAVNHPSADKLYVSTILCGDAPGANNTSTHEGQVVRTVCSGLNGLVPLEELQGRMVVVVCNLKPVSMRGVTSAAMLLAASPRPKDGEEDSHERSVDLVNPPPDAKAGERVWFEGWEGEPDALLNPKKKIWEMVQPGFTTTEDLKVAFDGSAAPKVLEAQASDQAKPTVSFLRTQSGAYCTVSTLKGAVVR